MTPYAVLLVRNGDSDDIIRAHFQALSRTQHPDANGGEPGPRWYEISEAYRLLKTDGARLLWWNTFKRLSGLCRDCKGYGTVGTRVLGKKIKVCEACGGEGRK